MHDIRKSRDRTSEVKSVNGSGSRVYNLLKDRMRRSSDPANETRSNKRPGDSSQEESSGKRSTDFSSRAKEQSSSGDKKPPPPPPETPRIRGLPKPGPTLVDQPPPTLPPNHRWRQKK